MRRLLTFKWFMALLSLIALVLLLEQMRSRQASGFSVGVQNEGRVLSKLPTGHRLPALPVQPGVYRFATFNIHKGRSVDGQAVMPRLTSIVDTVNVLGLQEVARSSWDGVHNYSEILAERVGNRHWVFAPTELRWLRPRGGNAIVSDLKPSNVRVSPVAGDRKDHQNFIDVELQLNGTKVRFINTHLTHRTAELRDQQFKQVVERFLASEHAVLVADMNMRADEPPMQELLQDPTVVDALGTIAERDKRPDLKPDEDVDWILLRNLEVIDAGRIPRGISDHPMLWADVRVESGDEH